MKKYCSVFIMLFMFTLQMSSFALNPYIIGGFRDGGAVGLGADESIASKIHLSFGFEGTTQDNPLLLFAGGKIHLANLDYKYPLYLGTGLVGLFGGKSKAGVYLSLIFENVLKIRSLFVQVGIDLTKSGSLLLQAGYFFR